MYSFVTLGAQLTAKSIIKSSYFGILPSDGNNFMYASSVLNNSLTTGGSSLFIYNASASSMFPIIIGRTESENTLETLANRFPSNKKSSFDLSILTTEQPDLIPISLRPDTLKSAAGIDVQIISLLMLILCDIDSAWPDKVKNPLRILADSLIKIASMPSQVTKTPLSSGDSVKVA